MKSLLFLGVLALSTAACSAVEPDRLAGPPTYTICLDQAGASRAVECRSVPPGRLSDDRGVCLCADPLDQRVEAPICERGEDPPNETRAFELARRDAARDGSLVGDTYQGQRICVRARTDRRGA